MDNTVPGLTASPFPTKPNPISLALFSRNGIPTTTPPRVFARTGVGVTKHALVTEGGSDRTHTMGWVGPQIHALNLALGEVGLASNYAAEFGKVGVGRHCIEGVGRHARRHSFRCILRVGNEWQLQSI